MVFLGRAAGAAPERSRDRALMVVPVVGAWPRGALRGLAATLIVGALGPLRDRGTGQTPLDAAADLEMTSRADDDRGRRRCRSPPISAA